MSRVNNPCGLGFDSITVWVLQNFLVVWWARPQTHLTVVQKLPVANLSDQAGPSVEHVGWNNRELKRHVKHALPAYSSVSAKQENWKSFLLTLQQTRIAANWSNVKDYQNLKKSSIISQQQRTKGLYCLSKGQQACNLYLLTVLFPKNRCISRLNGRNVGLARTLKRNLRDTAIAKTTRNRSCTRLSRECSRRFMNLGSRKAKGGWGRVSTARISFV